MTPKAILVLIVAIISCFCLEELHADWMVYECNELPLKAKPAWAVHNTNEPNGSQAKIIADKDNPQNKLLYINDKADAKTCFKMEWNADFSKGATLVIRMRLGAADGAHSINVCFRDHKKKAKFVMYPNKFATENGNQSYKMDCTKWHVYRFVIRGEDYQVHLDEQKDPILKGDNSGGGKATFFWIGVASTAGAEEVFFDYVLWNTSGAFLPEEKKENAADAISAAREHLNKGEYEQALSACERAIKISPNAYDAYSLRWRIISRMMAADDAGAKIEAEIKSFLNEHTEKPETLYTAYSGYISLPGGAQNVPQSLFDKMLQHPGSQAYLSALNGLAERGQTAQEKWLYNQSIIDEFDISNAPQLSLYFKAHQDMLLLAEKTRSLASDEYLDKLIERFLQANLAYRRNTGKGVTKAYVDAVLWRLKFSINMERALATLESAIASFEQKEEQDWIAGAVQATEKQQRLEKAKNDLKQLRGEIYFNQENWAEAYSIFKETLTLYPNYLTNLSNRFSKHRIESFRLLGGTLEGLGRLQQAIHYYTDAHFAPSPHPEALAGLKRVYQAQRGSLEKFDDFLKATEAEYRMREAEEREVIRQNLIKQNLDREATDFSLDTLDGQMHTLLSMRGKIVLFYVWNSFSAPCIEAIPAIKKVYERFHTIDDFVIWGVNSGGTPENIQAFLNEHQIPWQILLERNHDVANAYQITHVPTFVLIDKDGRWQYTRSGYNEWLGTELIWLVEALRTGN